MISTVLSPGEVPGTPERGKKTCFAPRDPLTRPTRKITRHLCGMPSAKASRELIVWRISGSAARWIFRKKILHTATGNAPDYDRPYSMNLLFQKPHYFVPLFICKQSPALHMHSDSLPLLRGK